MTGQHEPLWKLEVKSGAPEGQAFSAPHKSTYNLLNSNETIHSNIS